MVDILVNLIPEIVTLVIAVAVAVARTTDNQIDNKIAKLAKENKGGIVSAIRNVLGRDDEAKQKVRDAVRGK